MQNFNVTKKIAIAISNEQIVALRSMSRNKAMQYLNVNESQARKILNAVKSGELVEVVEKVAKTKAKASGLGLFIRENIESIANEAVTIAEAFNKLAALEGYEAQNVSVAFAKEKLRKTFWALGMTQEGRGRNAVWSR